MNRWRTLIAVLVSQLLLLLLALPAWGQSLCRRVTSAQELTDGRYVLMFSDGAAPAVFQPERGACLPACPRQVEGDAVVPPPDALWKLTFSQDAMWITLRTAAGLPLAPGENGTLTQGEWAWQLHGREGCFFLSARAGDQAALASSPGKTRRGMPVSFSIKKSPGPHLRLPRRCRKPLRRCPNGTVWESIGIWGSSTATAAIPEKTIPPGRSMPGFDLRGSWIFMP